VQGLLSRNGGLQAEAEQLRVQLDISRRNEAELARKAVACERTVESVVSFDTMLNSLPATQPSLRHVAATHGGMPRGGHSHAPTW
jgi:hypothetical protein